MLYRPIFPLSTCQVIPKGCFKPQSMVFLSVLPPCSLPIAFSPVTEETADKTPVTWPEKSLPHWLQPLEVFIPSHI